MADVLSQSEVESLLAALEPTGEVDRKSVVVRLGGGRERDDRTDEVCAVGEVLRQRLWARVDAGQSIAERGQFRIAGSRKVGGQIMHGVHRVLLVDTDLCGEMDPAGAYIADF